MNKGSKRLSRAIPLKSAAKEGKPLTSSNRRKSEDRDRRLSTLLDQVNSALLRVRERELAPVELSAIESHVLYVLDHAERPTTPAEISRWILRQPHSTSRLLQRMEAKGLIQKSKDLHRGNLVRISMTEKGRDAYNHSLKGNSIEQMMSSLSQEEKQQLDGLLRKVLKSSLEELRIKRDVPFP